MKYLVVSMLVSSQNHSSCSRDGKNMWSFRRSVSGTNSSPTSRSWSICRFSSTSRVI